MDIEQLVWNQIVLYAHSVLHRLIQAPIRDAGFAESTVKQQNHSVVRTAIRLTHGAVCGGVLDQSVTGSVQEALGGLAAPTKI